jgi:hypothetical protein
MKQTSFKEKMKDADEVVYHAKMAAMTLPKDGMCIVDDKTAVMDKVYFEELGEYSSTLPTGQYFGKRWKRNRFGNCPYWKCDTCGTVYGGWAQDGDMCKSCEGKINLFKMPEKWIMGEYYDMHSKDQIGIYWREIILL